MNYDDDFMNPKDENKSFFIRGVLIGAFAVMLCMFTTLAILIKMDILTVGRNSKTHIESTDDSLASKLDAKLSIIDSGIKDFYFERPADDVVLDNMCKAYLASFADKYTIYYTAKEFKSIIESSNGAFVGIGVTVGKLEDGRMLVSGLIDDAPAQKAGIQVGDYIISIDGKSVIDETLDDSTARIRGTVGSKVVVEVERDGNKIKIDVIRAVIDQETVGSLYLEDDIYYIQIAQFKDTTTEHFRKQYDECLKAGAKGIIIDVRENPGGTMTSVLGVLDMLCPKGLLMYTEDKNGVRENQVGKSEEEATIPLVVLVNGNSASAAEVFAGDLQDYGKATIVGTKTYGKGIVQTLKALGDGTGVRYTTSKYYTAKGQDIHGNGVTPDVVIEYVEPDYEIEEYTYKDDNQVMKAVEILKSKIK